MEDKQLNNIWIGRLTIHYDSITFIFDPSMQFFYPDFVVLFDVDNFCFRKMRRIRTRSIIKPVKKSDEKYELAIHQYKGYLKETGSSNFIVIFEDVINSPLRETIRIYKNKVEDQKIEFVEKQDCNNSSNIRVEKEEEEEKNKTNELPDWLFLSRYKGIHAGCETSLDYDNLPD
jgi:hypothetical protein